jgi:hypothetical protein
VELYLHSPNTPSWRGAQLKHRDNFTLLSYVFKMTGLLRQLHATSGLEIVFSKQTFRVFVKKQYMHSYRRVETTCLTAHVETFLLTDKRTSLTFIARRDRKASGTLTGLGQCHSSGG